MGNLFLQAACIPITVTLQLSFHWRPHGIFRTASKQWCNFAPLRKVSASETPANWHHWLCWLWWHMSGKSIFEVYRTRTRCKCAYLITGADSSSLCIPVHVWSREAVGVSSEHTRTHMHTYIHTQLLSHNTAIEAHPARFARIKKLLSTDVDAPYTCTEGFIPGG